MITYRRVGGLRMPRFAEVLSISDDGAFTMWRSVSHASALPAPIGRFAGQLDDPILATLRNAAAASRAAGSRAWPILPDSPVDTIEAGETTATLGIHEDGEGPWGSLAGVLRTLLHDLTDSPRAAIGLQVDGGARLVHLGTEALPIDLSGLALRVVHWRGGASQDLWTADHPGPALAAPPGWSLELPFDHGFAMIEGDRLSVQVTFAADDGSGSIPVSLQNA